MAKAKNIYRVPIAIKANTEAALTQAMINNNAKYDKEYNYFDIQKVAQFWVAWFYKDLKKDIANG